MTRIPVEAVPDRPLVVVDAFERWWVRSGRAIMRETVDWFVVGEDEDEMKSVARAGWYAALKWQEGS